MEQVAICASRPANRGRIRWLTIPALAMSLSLMMSLAHTQEDGSQASARSIGLVLTSWNHALYETPGMKECPDGLQPSEADQLKARTDSAEVLKKYGAGAARGPNGESDRLMPWLIEDPLPFKELRTTVGYGVNLDGTSDGSATAKSCVHEKFTSPEGEPVDNQLSRVLGCTKGWRKGGFNTEYMGLEFETLRNNRILVEITGVDDEKNDPDVEVTLYKGLDRLVSTAPGQFVPYLIQRVDNREPRFTHRTHGRIVAGVLITDPIAQADFSVAWLTIPAERRLKDLRLRLKLTESGAEGYFGGYEDLRIWWNLHAKTAALADAGLFGSATLYRALNRYADGFPDPATGKCTAISAQYKVTAVRALIPPPKREERVALSTPGAAR
jgi:hypothetical protein